MEGQSGYGYRPRAVGRVAGGLGERAVAVNSVVTVLNPLVRPTNAKDRGLTEDQTTDP